MSWWTFTDIFEEQGFNSEPFYGNSQWGLLNIYKVAKPSFRAFELLHETGNSRVPVTSNVANTTAGVLVTTNSTHLMVIAYNHDVPGAPITAQNMTIQIKGIDANKSYHVSILHRNLSNELSANYASY